MSAVDEEEVDFVCPRCLGTGKTQYHERGRFCRACFFELSDDGDTLVHGALPPLILLVTTEAIR